MKRVLGYPNTLIIRIGDKFMIHTDENKVVVIAENDNNTDIKEAWTTMRENAKKCLESLNNFLDYNVQTNLEDDNFGFLEYSLNELINQDLVIVEYKEAE